MNLETPQPTVLPGESPALKKKKSSLRIGAWIFGAVMVLLAARLIVGTTRLPSDIKDLVKELASAKIIEKPPVANAAGTLICVAHTTSNGVGVFFVDTKTKKEVATLDEWKNSEYIASWLNLIGWSPDDKVFACTVNEQLRLCDGRTGEPVATFPLPARIQSLAWTSPQTFVYADESSRLHVLQLEKARLTETAIHELPRNEGRPRSLAMVGTNKLVWQNDTQILQTDISSGALSPFFAEPPDRIANICFSSAANALLVTKMTTNRPAVYILGRVRLGPDSKAAGFEEWVRGPSILDAQWINQGKGYAYRAARGENSVLIIKRDSDSASETLFSVGQVWNVFCDGDSSRAYAVAAKRSEPAGVWECEPNTEPHYTFSPWDSEQVNLQFQPALVGYATYGDRHSARFTVVPPANFSRHKKYPLVIGTAGYEWTPIAHGVYAQALAHCGAFVALVNHRWNQSRPETVYDHTNNVMAVYNLLAANPNVDTNRVFLFGFSAGTLVVNDLVEKYPGTWRGVLLMNPVALPKPKDGLFQSVLLTAGSEENQDGHFQVYQRDLCKVGISSTWFVHADEQHVVRGQAAFYDRTMLMIDMVFQK